MSLKSLFDRPSKLPVLPKVVQELMQNLGRADVATSEIAAQLDSDPVLCAKLLRLANSAYFGTSRNIASAQDAVQMLGFAMVRNLVMGLGMTGTFPSVPGMDMPGFWRYSLQSASVARWLARELGLDDELAFTIGLLHGLGHLVMHAAPDAQMRELDARIAPLALGRADAERAALGYQHGEVSAELAKHWKFPRLIVEPLSAVPDPLRTPPLQPLAACVHVAAWRARVALYGWPAEQILASCPRDVGQALQRPFRWDTEESTLIGAGPGTMAAMPPMAELIGGLESLLG